jgi:Protein of unknown function (DUF1638)
MVTMRRPRLFLSGAACIRLRGNELKADSWKLKAAFMRFKAIICQVFTREMEDVVSRSPHCVEVEALAMGLHDLGAGMRPHLQERIDAADNDGYDAILLGYALCGRGTEGLRAGKTQLVLPRVHDCIGLLMGSHRAYMAYFENHPGVYYRSPGWIEFQTPGMVLEPAFASQKSSLGERRTLEELVAQYGEENGNYLFEQFNAFRRHYSGLTYISTGIASDDASRAKARAEAEREGWAFEEVKGTLMLLERLVSGAWDASDFLLVAPGATIRATLGDSIVDAS